MIHLPDTRTVLAFLVLATLLLPSAALAKKKDKSNDEPPAAEALPAAADLFARNVEAMGGEAALRGHKSQYARGTLSIPAQGLVMSLELWAEAPDRISTSMEMPGLGLFRSGYDGAVAWGEDPMSGATLQEGEALIQARRESDFYGDLNYATRYAQMQTIGLVPWGSYTAYQVNVVTPEGQKETLFFDKETGLHIGSEQLVETDMGPVPLRGTYDQHQVFGGVTLPTRCVEATGPIESIITFETIVFDGPDFALPAKPETVQALIDEQ